MAKRIGKYTLQMENNPTILSWAAVGSKLEGEGPLGTFFDQIEQDSHFGQDTWEKAESEMQKRTVNFALAKRKLTAAQMQYLFAGDLLNQLAGSTFGLRDLQIPFLGLYGACSTSIEGLSMAALFAEGGFCEYAAAVTSSHFCTAERQYRQPLEYGGQRTPTAQWTVTASGAMIIGTRGEGPKVTAVTVGRMQDMGISDANNMGAAMAPAAADTISRFFSDTGSCAEDYDRIVTGDLGMVGSDLLNQLMSEKGYPLQGRHEDCGLLIYNREKETKVDAGGSGCGCAASVLCTHFLPALAQKKLNNILFAATGAMLSPTTTQQGQSIPCVAHLVNLRSS